MRTGGDILDYGAGGVDNMAMLAGEDAGGYSPMQLFQLALKQGRKYRQPLTWGKP